MQSLESRAAELLRRHGYAASLQQLHGLLLRDMGPSAGTYHELYSRLKRARDFTIIERSNPLAPGVTWPAEARERYADAMHRAGVDVTPVVSLRESRGADVEDVRSILRRTLLALYEQVRHDAGLRDELAAALNEPMYWPVAAGKPTTTRLRRPPALPRMSGYLPRSETNPPRPGVYLRRPAPLPAEVPNERREAAE